MSDDLSTDPSDLGLPAAELPTVRWCREGYAAGEVDRFVERLRWALHEEPPAMAPYEVLVQRFTIRRTRRRYSPREVDDLLDAGQEALRKRHGYEPVTTRRPHAERHHFPVGWIYGVALVLIALMVLFVLTQL